VPIGVGLVRWSGSGATAWRPRAGRRSPLAAPVRVPIAAAACPPVVAIRSGHDSGHVIRLAGDLRRRHLSDRGGRRASRPANGDPDCSRRESDECEYTGQEATKRSGAAKFHAAHVAGSP
jgi:hypothetical protein